MKIISSQRYINDEIVANKIESGDFKVKVSPKFEIDGEEYQVMLDGHHSFAASVEAGVSPVIYEQDSRDNDNLAALDAGDIDGFLEIVYNGDDWYSIKTGLIVF